MNETENFLNSMTEAGRFSDMILTKKDQMVQSVAVPNRLDGVELLDQPNKLDHS